MRCDRALVDRDEDSPEAHVAHLLDGVLNVVEIV
jgi:hypothetical protein